jgi:saccharopine dehydrogenase (NAD+, L-lysine forming)
MRRSGPGVYVTLLRVHVLVVGAGGVGAAFAAIAQRRSRFAQVVLADVALERAQAAAGRFAEPDRFRAERSRTPTPSAL